MSTTDQGVSGIARICESPGERSRRIAARLRHQRPDMTHNGSGAALLHRRRLRPSSETVGMRTHRPRPAPAARSAFAGFRFPPDVIVLAVRWYLRFGLSYRDVEELLAERGVKVDHVTITCPHGGMRRPRTSSLSGPSARRRWRLQRSLLTGLRPIRWCWRSCSQRPGTEPSSTLTTGSRRTTAALNRGCDRCVGSSKTAAPGP
jgi:hypothetical protein